MNAIARNTITEWAPRAAGFAAAVLLVAVDASGQTGVVEKGRYLIHAGGCVTCHTAPQSGAQPLAGGHALDTPFGTFYAPNITRDEETGIGAWSDEDFLNALWNGVDPEGNAYYPAFPYTSYTGVSREDALAMKAYLFSLEPVKRETEAHELSWFISSRLAAQGWQMLNFEPARFSEDAGRSAEWNRGAYLVRHLGHCGECHTPRTRLGALVGDRELQGVASESDEDGAPNITSDREAGIGRWSGEDIEMFLEIGLLPDGDFAGGRMSAVIDDNTGQLTDADRRAIAVYLQSVEPGPEENSE